MTDPLVCLFLYDGEAAAAAGHPYQMEAAKLGMRPVAAAWHRIQIAPDGVVAMEAREADASGGVRRLYCERLRPDVLIHRKALGGPSEDLVLEIQRLFQPFCSYHPAWKTIGDKDDFEMRFRAAERNGATIARPRTWLMVPGCVEDGLVEAGRERPLIFKPATASLCEGILLSTPATFDCVLTRAAGSPWRRYAVQELIQEGPLMDGRRFDVRIYAIVTGFDPLRFTTLSEGVVRLAGKPWDACNPADPDAALTGNKYRKRRGLPVSNLPLARGIDAGALLQSVFGALFAGIQGTRGCFYLAGIDLLMTDTSGGHSLQFIETNYRPDLTGWGEETDSRLRLAHREWLSEVARACARYNCATSAEGDGRASRSNRQLPRP